MTYLYVAGEVLLINALILTGVVMIARKVMQQFGSMLKPPVISYPRVTTTSVGQPDSESLHTHEGVMTEQHD